MRFIPFLIGLIASIGVVAHGAELKNDRWRITIDEKTLETRATPADGSAVTLSAGSDDWSLGDVKVAYTLDGDELRFTFTGSTEGKCTWPIVDVAAPVKGLILPKDEGLYVPSDDADWRAHLVADSPLNTTAGLSMPFWGLDVGSHTISYILTKPFNNEIAISESNGALRMALTHEFTAREPDKSYSVIIRLGNPSAIEPAKQYRRWLIDNKQFVSMAEKIQRVPKVVRLLGAAHVYVWGDGIFSRYDARDWKAFCTKLKTHAIWQQMDEDSRKAAEEIIASEFATDFLKNAVATELSRLLATPAFADREAFAKAFGDVVLPPAKWGDGVSLTMLDQLKEAGLDRLCITTGDLLSAQHRPDVAKHADELGYVFGPYDSYHSIHKPGAADTWSTAQFDQQLYDTGAIIRKDGTPRHGFQKKGYMLSPLVAEPYAHQRVGELMGRVPFSSWFMDCDGFGEVFDDYSPAHPATQAEDAAARVKRMQWISRTYGIPIGTEGASAYAVPGVHFAHGVMTPVIGWGDPDLKEKSSKYFLGAYWPPDGPAVFAKQVPLKPKYAKFHFDPRYRLPLHQAVFHDSVIATHHWTAASLKYSDQVQTNALLELLYNVPPMYHLNRAEWKKHRERIVAQVAFFSPLHRETALLPMADFTWLTEDRAVQRTTFGDGRVEMIANFGEKQFDHAGMTIPARSIISRRLEAGAEIKVYSPAP